MNAGTTNADAAPSAQPSGAPELREAAKEAMNALATVHYNHMGQTFADVERCFAAAKQLYPLVNGPSGAPEVQPTDAELIETFIANNEQFSRSDMHPDWLHCRDGDGCSTSLRGDLFAATLRHIINGAKA